ncbi:MAG: C40 family peptidase, partial [Candidatus Kapabacteria bacterium]|nr:C40 family peptidase [Candidatus Kapabacteria bacterium]
AASIVVVVLSSCSSSVRFTSVRKPFSSEGGSTRESSEPLSRQSLSPRQRAVLQAADQWLGTPYCLGGTTQSCIDCSAFVRNVFQEAGIQLPRTSQQQSKQGITIPRNQMQPGDVVFFDNDGDGSANHAGIYVADGEMIHASTSNGVVYQKIGAGYFGVKFLVCKRFL